MGRIKENVNLSILKEFGFIETYRHSYVFYNEQKCKIGNKGIEIRVTPLGNIFLYCDNEEICIDKLFELAENNLLQKGKNHLTK